MKSIDARIDGANRFTARRTNKTVSLHFEYLNYESLILEA